MSEEAFRVQPEMVEQLGRVLELIGWFQAVIVVTATTSFIPDFVSDITYFPLSPAEVWLGCLGLHILAPLSVKPVVAHGTGQHPASGRQERRTTPQVEASVRPVAPWVHPVHWHLLCFMRRGSAGHRRAVQAAAGWW